MAHLGIEMIELDLPGHFGVTQEAIAADDALRARLRAMGAANFTVTWDSEQPRPTAVEAAAEINRVLDAIEAGDYEDITFGDED